VLVIEGTAVTIAMYCVIQFYIQLRMDLKAYSPFLKVLAIKLVIFLSFWQSFLISILTSSTFNVVTPNSKVAYPDLKVGVPSLLLCIEMAIFAVLHLFAFPWKPYQSGTKVDGLGPKQGGLLGWRAIADAMNPWDLVKGFARGMRWLFIGVKRRENDVSYKVSGANSINDLDLQPTMSPEQGYKRTESLPIADEFRRSKFGMPGANKVYDEGAGLIAHAQPNPLNNTNSGYTPARQRYDANGQEVGSGGRQYGSPDGSPDRFSGRNPEPPRRPEVLPRPRYRSRHCTSRAVSESHRPTTLSPNRIGGISRKSPTRAEESRFAIRAMGELEPAESTVCESCTCCALGTTTSVEQTERVLGT